jgi:hypothetical protein
MSLIPDPPELTLKPGLPGQVISQIPYSLVWVWVSLHGQGSWWLAAIRTRRNERGHIEVLNVRTQEVREVRQDAPARAVLFPRS